MAGRSLATPARAARNLVARAGLDGDEEDNMLERIVSVAILAAACALAAPAAAHPPTGNRADARLDRRGDRIDDRLDRRSERQEDLGHERAARRLDRRGDRIENRLDRRGDRIDRRRGGEAD
jgi:Ni/Co efflux regulator RcnB